MAATLPVNPNAAATQAIVPDPMTPSSDYSHSATFWKMVSDILGGAETMRASAHEGKIGGAPVQLTNASSQQNARRAIEPESPYLPKFPNEPYAEYDRRRRNAFLTNIYGDISNNLSSKPFSKTCQLVPDSPEDLIELSENIDGLGNNMHVFTREAFKTAMDKGITWIMPDYTNVPAGATLEDERNMGARAYWVHVPAEKLLAVYSKFLNGQEIIFHARIDETTTELDGYKEKEVKRVRELNRTPIVDNSGKITGFQPAAWKVLQEETKKNETTGKEVTSWNEIDSGLITIGIINLVPIILGKRDGTSWRVEPPLRDLTYMQVKLFQMESNLDCIKELTAFPMLSGNGINGVDNENKVIQVPVGPRAVLFAPPNNSGTSGSWTFIEPSGQSLTFLDQSIEAHKKEMRDLGYQPLDSTNLTVITTANVSAKANNAVQAWALMAKDAFEQAWKITCMWLKKTGVEPEVFIYTDFAVDIDGASDMSELQSLEKEKIISKKTMFEEAKRRGKLADEVDYDEEQEQIATEAANSALTPESMIDPVTGMPVVVTPEPGVLNLPPPPTLPRVIN